MTIAAHSQIAGFYQFRPPYTASFFQAAMGKLGLTRDSVLLDLCCGRGELAAGLAASCKTIFAVDGSAQMLEHRIAKPNVTFLLHDVNVDEVTLPSHADHFVVGSAIHWIEPAALTRWISRNLKPGGKVLVTHTLMKSEGQPWFPAVAEVNARFGRTGPGRSFEQLSGAETLRACGFRHEDGLRLVTPVQFDVDYLFRQQLSYLYRDAFEKVTGDLAGYRQQLVEAVAPFVAGDGKLSAHLVNWGMVYARNLT